MITLKEEINNFPIERTFENLKDACEVINLQVEAAENLIGKNVKDFKVTSVSKSKIYTIKFKDKIRHDVSWTIYFENRKEIQCFATITITKD